jgi:uncharacterized protein (TIGR04551 family)
MFRTLLVVVVAHLLFLSTALAQLGPGMGSMGRRPQRGGGDDKPDKPKVVEAAKTKPKGPRPIPPKKWGTQRPMQFFELDGYFRFRPDFFYKPHLGLRQYGNSPQPPYINNPVYDGSRHLDNQKQFLSANMRLRLQPIINVHETVRVHLTFDVFDNRVMGTTPQGFTLSDDAPLASIPTSTFSTTQIPVDDNNNATQDAIRVKHAWAEILTPLGQIKVGRMPSHWGMGMLAHSGSCRRAAQWSVEKTHNPGMCLDADYEEIVDRVMFTSRIPGIGLIVALGYDFASQGVDTSLVNIYRDAGLGQPVDLFESDDVHQAVVSLAMIDKPAEVRRKLAQGKLVINYGFYGLFRRQKSDLRYDANIDQSIVDPQRRAGYYASILHPRKAWTIIPDIWFRLNWGKLQVEFEGVLIGGKVGNLKDANRQKALTLLQWGFVLRSHYKFLDDALKVQLEIGSASGDDNLESVGKTIHHTNVPVLPLNGSDTYNTLFRFDPSFYVDLIFFRELMGTVYNATYYKPSIMYDIAPNLGVRADAIFSMANQPVASPGNDRWYGIELDADVEYRNIQHGFTAGVSYGVFFPLGALNFPRNLFGRHQDAKPAQTVQGRLVVKF